MTAVTTEADKGPKQVFTRLPSDLARLVEAAADRELISVAAFARRALAMAVRKESANGR
jgi:predicted HicB family RNase H-like nuclease